jgi:hypothetical protein
MSYQQLGYGHERRWRFAVGFRHSTMSWLLVIGDSLSDFGMERGLREAKS